MTVPVNLRDIAVIKLVPIQHRSLLYQSTLCEIFAEYPLISTKKIPSSGFVQVIETVILTR